MTPLGYRIRRGHFGGASAGSVPEWSAHAPGYLHDEVHQVCLVVTGDVIAANARLGPTTRAEVVAAAQAIIDAWPEWPPEGGEAMEFADWCEHLATLALDAARSACDG